MKYGVLSDYFDGVGAKYLTTVEVTPHRSNQHEFQGVGSFRQFLGTPSEKVTFPTSFFWLTDKVDAGPVRADAFCTWSDVRRDNPNRSAEFHLYYSSEANPVVYQAHPGDLMIIARHKNGSLRIILAPAGSTIAAQLLWLFGLDPKDGRPASRELGTKSDISLGFAARAVLEEMEIEVEEPEPDAFDLMLKTFGVGFPATIAFSQFARDTTKDVSPLEDPDGALMAWMEQEEALFRRMEREIISERLKQGFAIEGETDVDGFLSFSLSVQNRRKSRAGHAFEYHTEAILQAHKVRYKRQATTEKRSAADFLFPGEKEYFDPSFPAEKLFMLGVKTTCKDRWRQVLSEADRIEHKHLLTIQPAISSQQTEEMREHNLQLVLPAELHSTYTVDQRKWLMNVQTFLKIIQ